MKDKNLRDAILVTAQSYLSRGDDKGNLVHAMLTIILRTAETFDKAEKTK